MDLHPSRQHWQRSRNVANMVGSDACQCGAVAVSPARRDSANRWASNRLGCSKFNLEAKHLYFFTKARKRYFYKFGIFYSPI